LFGKSCVTERVLRNELMDVRSSPCCPSTLNISEYVSSAVGIWHVFWWQLVRSLGEVFHVEVPCQSEVVPAILFARSMGFMRYPLLLHAFV
jgi:hypothetical protein